jgi:hypothetical protein
MEPFSTIQGDGLVMDQRVLDVQSLPHQSAVVYAKQRLNPVYSCRKYRIGSQAIILVAD